MIDGTEPAFPNLPADLILDRFQDLWSDTDVKPRPLATTDRSETVGVYPAYWTPREDSFELMGRLPGEPTLGRYTLMIQCFIKDSDRERAGAKHSIMTSRTRNVLYRDAVLRIALPQLSVEYSGVTERLKRWGVQSIRYYSNELKGTWVFLSSLELWIETETN